jgi:hypothetical protein
MKSFTDPGNRLGVNRSLDNGIISIDSEKTYHLEYILKDVFKNTGTLTFDITGKKTVIPQQEPGGVYFPFNRDNAFTGQGVDLKIPRKNLYADIYLQVETIPGHTPFAPFYHLGERIPLHSYCPLTLNITNDIYPDKSKYGVVSYWRNQKNWQGGQYENGKITAEIRELGNFSVEIDTVPPKITPVREVNWATNRRIAFKISDDLSGIKAYKGTIDGKFVLFEYDYKTNSLYCVYDPKRMGKGALKLVVTDDAGNQSEFQKTVAF